MPAVARASIAFASCTTRRLEFICSPVLPTRRSPIRVEYERRLRVRQFVVGWSRGLSGRVRLGRDVCSRRRRAAEGADQRVSRIDNTIGISMIPSSNGRPSHNAELLTCRVRREVSACFEGVAAA